MTTDLFKIGTARRVMNVPVENVMMLGFGDVEHIARGAATPLYARGIVIVDSRGKKLVMVCLEVCLITEALRAEVLKRTGLAQEELILSATHTHSAPGGYSTDVVYAIAGGGFVPAVFEGYVRASVEVVKEAMSAVRPGKIRFGTGLFEDKEPVAFNRSIRAWLRNPEAKTWGKQVGPKDTGGAVDRELTLLRFEDEEGKPIAVWNWFPVHTTSMHRDRYLVHSDNKGLAASGMEAELVRTGATEFVAVFAQGAAGDVSPSFQRFSGLREMRGAFRDDEQSCRYNADLQMHKALEVFHSAAKAPALVANLDSVLEFHDFSKITVDPEFVGGRTGLHTGPAEVGLPQLYGTAEARGLPLPLVYAVLVIIWICRIYCAITDRLAGRTSRWPWTDDLVQGRKATIIQSGERKVFETTDISRLIFPVWFHLIVAMLKRWGKNPALRERPFTPHILPIQIARLGNLAIAAVPAEFTTVSGMRVRKTLEKLLRESGTNRVVIQGYANSCSSYVTTPEEYVSQEYEGGCTLFGRWTLPAYLTAFRAMTGRFLRGEPPVNLRPPEPSQEFMRMISEKN